MPGIHKSTFDIRILFTALLAGLLLVAPCKVRNSLEHALGLEKSEVSNKIKTTVSTSCASYEAVQHSESTTSHQLDRTTAPLPAVTTPSYFAASNSGKHLYVAEKQSVASVVPLYILYRQFKIYS
ncbi:hypothetical protein [Flagellimonas sp.]|jgi:hypothetical protein|uniref:hypothetical protein n=1 Tax=Flagellimonas sp. TaxID=2058762 RepID=UPI003BAB7793